MSNDNYKAPSTPLLDPAELALPERPRNVSIAIGLVGGGALIQLLAFVRNLQAEYFQVANPWMLAFPIGSFLLFGVICHQLAHRRTWPRLLLLIITVATFAQTCWAFGFVLQQLPESIHLLLIPDLVIPRVLPLVMNLAALHLLYYSSGDWFRKSG